MTHFPTIPGFLYRRIEANGVTLNVALGGSGPPLLLLHGAPQSHLMWRKIAPRLAEKFTVIAPDLRGYGQSDKPEGGGDHSAYAKATMARDNLALMQGLGFTRFFLCGHDRGARVARRLAKDFPDAVERLAILDIAPTAHIYNNLTLTAARNLWHWFALIQPAPVPELLIGPSALAYVHGAARLIAGTEDAVAAAYAAGSGTPEGFHAMCEDYRAGASIDLDHDMADAEIKITAPTLVMYGAKSPSTGLIFNIPAIWAGEVETLSCQALDCGHFLPEEKPEESLAALLAHFA
jgi:haloacetate dehalogenase